MRNLVNPQQIRLFAGSRGPGGVPCDFTESGRLEYAAGGGLRKNAKNCA